MLIKVKNSTLDKSI